MLRLGFHDCLKYSDDVPEGEINGCDGCLDPKGMYTDIEKVYGGKGSKNGPDVHVTDNNGLAFTADVLHEMFINASFANMEVSMQEKGYSRADLWAFASLIALKMGVDNNNYACQGGDVAR